MLGWLEVLRVLVICCFVSGRGSVSSGPLILVRICLRDCNYCNDIKDFKAWTWFYFSLFWWLFRNVVKLFLNWLSYGITFLFVCQGGQKLGNVTDTTVAANLQLFSLLHMLIHFARAWIDRVKEEHVDHLQKMVPEKTYILKNGEDEKSWKHENLPGFPRFFFLAVARWCGHGTWGCVPGRACRGDGDGAVCFFGDETI